MLALIFQVGSERVAMDVRRVREVLPRVQLAPVNDCPSWISGVFVYRGHIVPVVDLHSLTGAGECPGHLSSRIILLPFPPHEPDSLIGLLATQVAEIRELQPEQVRPLPAETDRPGLGPVLADGASILRWLDPDRLLQQISTGSSGLDAAKKGILRAVPAAGPAVERR